MDPESAFDLFGTSASTMLTVLVFLATATLAFAVMLGVRAREAVQPSRGAGQYRRRRSD